MSSTTTGAPAVLVFSDDWGRHPSSCQHLMARIAVRRPVIWVNTIGTRPFKMDMRSFARAAEKFGQWFSPFEKNRWQSTLPPAGSNPAALLSPLMWPSFRSRGLRALNRRLMLHALRPVLAELPTRPIVVTTLPIVSDLVGAIPARAWIYYCVDDFSVWPGYDGPTLSAMERELVPKVERIVAVSDELVDRIGLLGKRASLLTHGVDLDRWCGATGSEPVAELAGLEPPYVVFWGTIDRRLDLAVLRALSQSLSHGSIVLFGPADSPSPEILELERVHLRPAVAFERLPAIGAAARVLIMPYADMPATRMLQPLKLKEYLASGRPAVVAALPANQPWADACDVCAGPDAFVAKVLVRLAEGLPSEQRVARHRLVDEAWAAKAEKLEHWLDEAGQLSVV